MAYQQVVPWARGGRDWLLVCVSMRVLMKKKKHL